jgi:hypothetical protein
MSKWRAKRRYQANRRFGERADDALVAVSVLHARVEGVELDRTDADLREKLATGRELLDTVRTILDDEAPPEADPFEIAVAENVAEERGSATRRIVSKLDDAAAELETARETLQYHDGLEDAREWLELVSDVASRTSQAAVDQLRGDVAGRTH